MIGKCKIGVGLIGSGFMGKAHALGYATAARVFGLPFEVDFAVLADADPALAGRAAGALGFQRSTGRWRDLLDDPEVHVVSVTTPNTLHREMALAALAAGKHVWCEKPLAPTAAEALEMAEAAETAGLATQVGFNYLKNPMVALAREIAASGEIGDIRTFRGVHAEDYMADAQAPWAWRLDPAGGGGALADVGSHILAAARHLVGPVAALMADVHPSPNARSAPAPPRRARWRWTTWPGCCCASKAARPAAWKRTGSPRAARCSTTSNFTARRARSCSRRSASTSCRFTTPGTGRAGAGSAPCSPGRSTSRMERSAWRRAIRSASMI